MERKTSERIYLDNEPRNKIWVAVDDLKKLEEQCDSKIQFYNELMDKLNR